MAKKGAEENSGNTLSTNISMKLFKSSIKEWLYNKSNYNLHQSFGARHSKQTVGNFSKQNKSIA